MQDSHSGVGSPGNEGEAGVNSDKEYSLSEFMQDDKSLSNVNRFDRRKFLALAGGFGGAGVLAAVFGPKVWEQFFSRQLQISPTLNSGPSTPSSSSSETKKLVLITLYGGNDGLNTVIPYTSSIYEASRGSLAIQDVKVLPLAEGFGLHPSMPKLKTLWDQKKLAIVQGVGYDNPSFSHFQSMDVWQSGVPGESVSTGWMGRWLDATNSSPLRAVSISPTLPVLLTGEKIQGATIPPGKLVLPGDSTEQLLYEALTAVSTGGSTLLREAAASSQNLLSLNKKLGPILVKTASSDPLHLANSDSNSLNSNGGAALAIANGGGGLSSSNVLATQLSIVANLILAGAMPDVFSVELGGFDTHSNQLSTQEKLLAELDDAVAAFVDVMGSSTIGAGVVVMVYTEFGRRVSGNSSLGTDHGWANNVFVVGPNVKGGFYGVPPSLDHLQEGNLVFTTDFRKVYSTMFESVLGVDSKTFLQGTFSNLGMV